MNKIKKIAMFSAVIPMLVACSANAGSNHKTTNSSTQKTEKVQTGPKSNKPKDMAEHYNAIVPETTQPKDAKEGDIVKTKVISPDGKEHEIEFKFGSIYNDADGGLHYVDKDGNEQVIKK